MPYGTPFLSEDGEASIASALLMSHHAFRRDAAAFARALEEIERGDTSRAAAVREEWQFFRGALHGHHEMEDTRIFPGLIEQNPSLAPKITALSADHRKIDPLLERGDRAFAALPATSEARAVLGELRDLLEGHLAPEEATIIPSLRAARGFPPPQNDEEANLYAGGFAWSSHGVAQDVLDRVYGILPAALTARLPAARATFAARCERTWGTAHAGASRTSVPEAPPG